MGFLLPTSGLLPLTFLLPSRMECEEEVQSADKTIIEATEERRRSASPHRARRLPAERGHARGLVMFDRPTVDRSEYSSLNGIGAPLRR